MTEVQNRKQTENSLLIPGDGENQEEFESDWLDTGKVQSGLGPNLLRFCFTHRLWHSSITAVLNGGSSGGGGAS